MKSGVSPQILRNYRWQTPIWASICTPVAPSLLISSGHSPRFGGARPRYAPRGAGSGVECGKFKLKQAFQSGKILACSKKSEISATSTLKLIKMMLKCQVAKAFSICMLY